MERIYIIDTQIGHTKEVRQAVNIAERTLNGFPHVREVVIAGKFAGSYVYGVPVNDQEIRGMDAREFTNGLREVLGTRMLDTGLFEELARQDRENSDLEIGLEPGSSKIDTALAYVSRSSVRGSSNPEILWLLRRTIQWPE